MDKNLSFDFYMFVNSIIKYIAYQKDVLYYNPFAIPLIMVKYFIFCLCFKTFVVIFIELKKSI